MKSIASILAVAVFALSTPALAEDAVPQFRVEPFWPKPLPNNWILGQVAGIATDKYDRIWVVRRPLSLTPRERAGRGADRPAGAEVPLGRRAELEGY